VWTVASKAETETVSMQGHGISVDIAFGSRIFSKRFVSRLLVENDRAPLPRNLKDNW